MDYILYFRELLANHKRLTEGECVYFERILTQKQDQLRCASEQTLKVFILAFCKVYWDSDKALDAEPLHRLLINLKKNKQMALIPELIYCSRNYPKYVFWAQEMLDKLPEKDQKTLNLPPILWTSNTDGTLISKEEYAYRLRKKLSCWNECYRPCELNDLLCYQAWLDMIVKTDSTCLFFNG